VFEKQATSDYASASHRADGIMAFVRAPIAESEEETGSSPRSARVLGSRFLMLEPLRVFEPVLLRVIVRAR
jgi:hypothetical protein